MWRVGVLVTLGFAALCNNTGYDCGAYGVCQSVNGVFQCICSPGWTGYNCDRCVRGYVLIGERCIAADCIEDGMECGGRGTCLFKKETKTWSCGNCPKGFLQYGQRCISSLCYNADEISGMIDNPPCGSRGICTFTGATEADRVKPVAYTCACNIIFSGNLCQDCDLQFGILDSAKNCVARSCYNGDDDFPCQNRGVCITNIQQHPFTGENVTGYICSCSWPYVLVGTAKCLPGSCVSYQLGQATECGTGGSCQEDNNAFTCKCKKGFIKVTDGHCTAPSCRSEGNSVCSDVGSCVTHEEDINDQSLYACQCPPYTSGLYCEICDGLGATKINGKCVPNSCISDNTVCSGQGECVLSSYREYVCKCNSGYTKYHTNVCAKSECWDSVINKTCSGAGTCTSNSGCSCNSEFTRYGSRCIPNKLKTNNTVCNNNGTAVVMQSATNYDDPNQWKCRCNTATTGELCAECNTSSGSGSPGAYLIDGKCVSAACVSINSQSNTIVCSGVSGATCSREGIGADSFFFCESGDPKKNVVAYNTSLIVERPCTYLSATRHPLNLYCGLLDGYTVKLGSTGAPQCINSMCQCTGSYNLVKKKDYYRDSQNNSLYRMACIHTNCLNPDLKGTTDDSILSDPSSYCNGIGDCFLDDNIYRCFCKTGSTYFNNTCIPDICLTTDPLTDTTVICGGKGTCSIDSNGIGGCVCDYPYFGYEDSCYPASCGYMDPLSRITLLCGGHGRGTCEVNSTHIELSECRCSIGFVRIGTGYCAPSACVAFNAEVDHIPPDLNYVCSGVGSCFRDPITLRYECSCPESYYSEGPYCTRPICLVRTGLIEISQGVFQEYTLECGFAGAGTCQETGCICNSGYVKAAGRGICVHVGCTDSNSNYCGGDSHAVCLNKDDGTGYACQCSYSYSAIDGTCFPKSCVSPGVDGKNTICNGRGECIALGENNICMCKDGLPASYISTSNGVVSTCPHPDCYDRTGAGEPTLCSGQGNCEETKAGGRCNCNNGYTLVGTGQCIISECVQTDGNGVSTICGGVGKCVVKNGVDTCECNTGFNLFDGKCIPKDCISKTLSNEDAECSGFGRCTPKGSSYYCVCLKGFIAVGNNRCLSAECVSTIDNVAYECGGKGTCSFEESDDVDSGGRIYCACDNGYENVTTTDGFVGNVHLCVSKACKTKTPDNNVQICSGGGFCSPTTGTCQCTEGYVGSTCADCANGYERPPKEFIFSQCLKSECADRSCGGAGQCVPSILERKMVCECANHHSESGGRCQPCIIDGCERCELSLVKSTCAFCRDGTYLSADETQCLLCHSDCRTCVGGGSDNCTSCVAGKVHSLKGISPGLCVAECRENVKGCKVCGAIIYDTKYCSQCSTSTSVPINGECTPQVSRAGECIRYSNGKCLVCADGYFIFQGGCYKMGILPGKDVCAVASKGNCTLCKSGYGVTDTGCKPCAVPNCSSCDASSKCNRCKNGWSLLNGACVQCAENCADCQQGDPNTCYSCKDTHFTSYIFSGNNGGTCRPCSDPTSMDGIVGTPKCKYCTLPLTNGTNENPTPVVCLDAFWPGKPGTTNLSTGAIAGITIAVIIVVGGGIAGVLAWLFLFKRYKNLQKLKKYRSSELSASLLSQDHTSSML